MKIIANTNVAVLGLDRVIEVVSKGLVKVSGTTFVAVLWETVSSRACARMAISAALVMTSHTLRDLQNKDQSRMNASLCWLRRALPMVKGLHSGRPRQVPLQNLILILVPISMLSRHFQ